MRCNFVFIFLGMLHFTVAAQVKTIKKVALIVAISNYADTKWPSLSSKNDIGLIRESLIKQGFPANNITVITDKQATLAGIKAAIDKDLIQKVDSGDIAVFHFSGHGQQMDDDNGDEGDGLDEALVPYDAPIEYNGGPEKHFRDDQLGMKLDEVRKKLGAAGDFLVIIDACHSGTSTRGLTKSRGTTQVYHSPNPKKSATGQGDKTFGIREDGLGKSPMACFFASAPTEQNQEANVNNNNTGSLSLAFSRALARSEKDSSYRSLFESIKIEMSSLVSNQTPMAEGDLDRTLFAGRGLGKPRYHTVQKADKTDPKKITVSFGKLYGIFEGTTVNLYKADTRDTNNVKPIARGKVVFAGEYSSEVELDRKLDTLKLMSAWIYFDEINYGDLAVKVQLRIEDAELRKAVAAMFKNVKQATLVEDGADLFVEEGMEFLSKDSVYITDRGERTIWKINKSIQPKLLEDSLVMNVGDYARARYLKNLDLKNIHYKVTVEFVQLICVSGCGTRSAKYRDGPIKAIKGDSLHIAFKLGDKFRLNIINESDQKRLYYTVLDIQPDNKVNVMIPGEDEKVEGYYIPQQSKIELQKTFTVGLPLGTDMLKVIASDVAIDLRSMVTSRGVQTRGGPKSPFEKVMQSTYNAEKLNTRGTPGDVIKPDTVNIETISFNIVQKQSK